jgi:hypothetical protein
LESQSEKAFRETVRVFEKSRFPKGQSVGGRDFVHITDDTKDHWADRTPDLSYMMAPQRSVGLAEWRKNLMTVIKAYAKLKKIPATGLLEVTDAE